MLSRAGTLVAMILLLVGFAIVKPSAAPADRATIRPVPSADVASRTSLRAPMLVTSPALPAELPLLAEIRSVPERLATPEYRPAGTLDPKTQKLLDKLDKKLQKSQDKLTKLETKQSDFDAQIDQYETDLDLANQLPEGTAQQQKAKAKAIKKLEKKLARLAKKKARMIKKMVKATDKVGDVAADIEDIDPGHFNDLGIVGLEVAGQMSVVTVDDGGQGGGGGGQGAPGNVGNFPPEADYNTDPVWGHVWDPSMEPIAMVNEILCYMAQTGYEEMVNKGDYLAQIDGDRCRGSEDPNASQSGQSSGAGGGDLELWTLNSARGGPGSLQVVKLWVPEPGHEGDGEFDDPMPPMTIHVETVVTSAKSQADPFGRFSMNFAGVPDGFGVNKAPFHGNLSTLDADDGLVGFTLYEAEGVPGQASAGGRTVQAHVNMAPDLTQGIARVRTESWGFDFGHEGEGDGEGEGGGGEASPGEPGEEGSTVDEFLIAFDETHLLRAHNDEPAVCYDRNDFDSRVWRYNLYDATTGDRIERNSGIGVRSEDGDYGWAGYWGVWFPDDVEIGHGDVVVENLWDGDESAADSYTLFVAPGRLIENTKHTVPLASVDGTLFEWWTDDPQTFQHTRYQVVYDHGLGAFQKVATFDEQSHSWTSLPQPESIDVVAVGGWLGMWSPGLGGAVNYQAGDTVVTYWEENFVGGDHALFAGGDDVALYGYFDCLGADIDQQDAESGDVYLPPMFEVGTPHGFVFSRGSMALRHDTDGSGNNLALVGLADGASPQHGPFTWGLRTGPLVTDTAGLADVHEIWDQPVFYTYETGPNSWNRFMALVDGEGQFVAFDAPLAFTYFHTTGDDANGDSAYDGQPFFLEYHGAGDLHGIPFEGVDFDGDGWDDRWYPQLSIADGTLMGPTGVEYVVRAIDRELTLREDIAGCGNLSIATAGDLVLPDEDIYTAPDIGKQPRVDDPPAVINGFVQTPDEE